MIFVCQCLVSRVLECLYYGVARRVWGIFWGFAVTLQICRQKPHPSQIPKTTTFCGTKILLFVLQGWGTDTFEGLGCATAAYLVGWMDADIALRSALRA